MISVTATGAQDVESAALTGEASVPSGGERTESNAGTKIFRLFSLSFHHFPDDLAARVLRSSLETSDGFAIIELQDRRLWSLALMVADLPLLMLVTLLWFWSEPIRLLFTYALPVLPVVMTWDGLVSCLRTREFEEVVRLLEHAGQEGEEKIEVKRTGEACIDARIGGLRWVLEGQRKRHTWPVGYMNVVVGRKLPL